MAVLRDQTCACGHARREHCPKGCTRCMCDLRAPILVSRPDGTQAESWATFHEPFQKGNVVAVRHGATSRSDRLVAEKAERLLAELVKEWPWLADADAITVDILVKEKTRYDSLDEYVWGVVEGTTKVYPRKGYPTQGWEAVPDRVLQALDRAGRQTLAAAAKLGLNPVDRAGLMKDTGMAHHFGREKVEELVTRGHKRLRELRGGE